MTAQSSRTSAGAPPPPPPPEASNRGSRLLKLFGRTPRSNRDREGQNSRGDGNDEDGQGREDGEGGGGGEQRPHRLTRLFHRRRDQNPIPVTRVPLNDIRSGQGDVGLQLSNTVRIVSAAAAAAGAWVG
ncbi:hypothetical protein B0H65DRAFT_477260 [Neurospora tetraspora]|uniref:Uncharacterized protein n=1 Tax=Neurospora tetraspora TaxID=94610 RepID=A0AAE0MMH3_9PEZI|nr:hypothetical protein B0H65DRAFT_477260 [Neurospora tetraspora]